MSACALSGARARGAIHAMAWARVIRPVLRHQMVHVAAESKHGWVRAVPVLPMDAHTQTHRHTGTQAHRHTHTRARAHTHTHTYTNTPKRRAYVHACTFYVVVVLFSCPIISIIDRNLKRRGSHAHE